MTFLAWFPVAVRSVLALVFLSAGLLKLTGTAPLREMLAGFGFTGRPASVLARVLPAAEIAVGLALIWPATTLPGAVAGLMLLAAFTVVIVAALRRGDAPPCNCFGALTPAPIDRRTIWRNGILSVLAVFAVGLAWRDPGPSLVGWAGPPVMGGLVVACVVLAISLAGTAQTLRRLLQTQREQQAHIDALEAGGDARARAVASVRAAPTDDGLPVGAAAPAFTSRDTHGEDAGLAALLARGRPLVLLSVGAHCIPCRALAPRIREWAYERRHDVTVVAVYADGVAQPGEFGDHVTVLAEHTAAIAKGYRLHWTPGAVVVDRHGTIASGVAFGDDAIRTLLATLASMPDVDAMAFGALLPQTSGALPIGSAVPQIHSGDKTGSLALLFWKSACPHCQAMEPQVRTWAASPPTARGPSRVVVVNWSAAPVTGLDGVAVIEDSGGELARTFGVSGTPSAVLIDADGRVASTVGVGGGNVLALLGARSSATA